ncbi:hypothetical protein D3C72_2351180 [compost metagenome]
MEHQIWFIWLISGVRFCNGCGISTLCDRYRNLGIHYFTGINLWGNRIKTNIRSNQQIRRYDVELES